MVSSLWDGLREPGTGPLVHPAAVAAVGVVHPSIEENCDHLCRQERKRAEPLMVQRLDLKES
jgi:hypothetical protein